MGTLLDVDAARPVRTYDDKLAPGAHGQLRLVAKTTDKAWTVPVTDAVTERVWAAARRCHRALGCRQYSLFDFRIDPDGRPWFLEAGLYCSFATTSVLTAMACAAGTPLPDLFGRFAGEILRECGVKQLKPALKMFGMQRVPLVNK